MAGDRDGNKWFSTYGDEGLKYDITTATLKGYTFSTSNYVDKVFVDSDNIVWAALREKRTAFGTVTRQPEHSGTSTSGMMIPGEEDDILTIFEDSRRRLWVGTWLKGVGNSTSIQEKSAPTSILPASAIITSTQYPNTSRQLFIGTDEGLILFDILSGNYEYYVPDYSDPPPAQ